MMISNLHPLKIALLEMLLSDETLDDWNPWDKECEALLSKQEAQFNFTGYLSDEDIEERTASLFAQF